MFTIPRSFAAPAARLALVALLALSPPELAAQDDAAALVTRTYDLAQHAPDVRHEHISFPLLPYDDGYAEHGEELNLQELAYQLVQDVVAPEEFAYEGRRLEPLGGTGLLVTAPAAVHADVARFVQGLGDGFRRRARLELSVERLADGLGPSEQLAQRDAAALRAAGLSQGGHHQVLELAVGQAHRVRSEQRDQLVRRWESEIAQSSTSVVPVTALLRTGLDLVLRLEADIDGGFVLRSAGRVGAISRQEARRVAVSGYVINETGPVSTAKAAPVDDVVVAWAAFSGAARLRPGESAHQLLWTRTEEGTAGWLLGLRLIEVAPEPELRFGDVGVSITDVSSLYRAPQYAAQLHDDSEFESPEELLWIATATGRSDNSWSDWNEGLRLPLPAGDAGFGDRDEEALHEFFELGAEFWSEGNWVVAWGPPEALASWRADALAPLVRDPALILEVGVDGAGRAKASFAEPHARLHLNLLGGDELTALVGDARSYMAGFETDVAHASWVRTPEVADLLDGLYLRALSSAEGAQLDLSYARVLEWNRLELDYASHSGLDRPRLLSGSLSARLRPDGERRVLGEIAPASGDGPRLQVWARLRPGVAAN